MDESRSRKMGREKAFAKIGEYDYGDKQKITPEVVSFDESRKIYYDGRQFSVKIPAKILQGYWTEGDSLKFIKTKNVNGDTMISVDYVKKKAGKK